jgi:hypothetical protein
LLRRWQLRSISPALGSGRHAEEGKSLSAIWRDLVAKCSKGEFTKAEITEALEKSARRKNTRIPAAFQNILLQILSSAHE